MLFATEAILQRRIEISKQNLAGEISDLEAGTQFLEADPDCATGYLFLSGHYAGEGDYRTAGSYAWQALQRVPCDARGYLSLANILHKLAEDDAVGRRLMALGCWKVSFQEEVPGVIAELVGALEPDAPLSGPASYGALAIALEEQAEGEQVPDDRLVPYELLNETEVQAEPGLEPDLLSRILGDSAALIPLWRAALRDWKERGYTPQADALGMIVALLGETAGPEMAADLMELADSGDSTVFLHTNWAIWRLGQRFPAEALATLVSAKRVTLRCAAAEHIPLLPKIPGREAALSKLLEGFADFAKDGEAAFLLAAVVSGLERLSRFTDGERALRQFQKLLRKDDRKWLQDELDAGFIGRLEDSDIEDLTIQEICSDRILMDEDDEESDEDFGDFDEEEVDEFDDIVEPVIAPAKPGRNDPCWCGSGKKYKKCHLAADEETERGGGGTTEPVHERVYGLLTEALRKWISRSDFEESARLYFGLRPEEVDAEVQNDRMNGFFEWCFHDFRPPSMRRTLIEECLRRPADRLSTAERKLLEEWREARFGIWEVQTVKKGEGVELKDRFEGDRFFVHDVSSSRSMLQWDCVLSRIYHSDGRWYFAGNSGSVPRNVMDRLTEQIERESREAGQNAGHFVRGNSHRWQRLVDKLCVTQLDDLRLVNAEGDEWELSTAEYQVKHEAAAATALGRVKQFESLEDAAGVHRFGWLEQTKGPRRSYGSIEIRDGKLRLECNSRKRLKLGRQLIEKHAGKWLHHEGDSFQSQAEFKQRAFERTSEEREDASSPLPDDVQQELSLKLKAEYYERWMDEPIPALDGRTPREATRSETGRKALEDLLRLMENMEAHIERSGGAAFDSSRIRKKLGI